MPTKSRGYSLDFAQAVQAADQRLIGVKLGALCISKRISVREVAARMRVTRQTVYWWFTGETVPQSEHATAIEKMIAELSS